MHIGYLSFVHHQVPLVNKSHSEFYIYTFHPSGDQDQLHINLMCHISSVIGVHTKELNLIQLKCNNNLPDWYPIFKPPLLRSV